MTGEAPELITVYVYRHSDGRTQVRCTDTGDKDLVIDILEEGLLAMTDGTEVITS